MNDRTASLLPSLSARWSPSPPPWPCCRSGPIAVRSTTVPCQLKAARSDG